MSYKMIILSLRRIVLNIKNFLVTHQIIDFRLMERGGHRIKTCFIS